MIDNFSTFSHLRVLSMDGRTDDKKYHFLLLRFFDFIFNSIFYFILVFSLVSFF